MLKVDKKTEKKFQKTKEGEKLYKGNIIGCLLYGLSFIGLLYVTLSNGKELNCLMITIALLTTFSAIVGSFLFSAYYFTLKNYTESNKKGK